VLRWHSPIPFRALPHYVPPADSSLFTFDAIGNVLSAINRYARIKRVYTLNGLITRDSLIFGR
jgi:hypothetical protein